MRESEDQQNFLLSVPRLAKRLSRHPNTVRAMLADPKTRMPSPIRIGARTYFESGEVETWIKSQKG